MAFRFSLEHEYNQEQQVNPFYAHPRVNSKGWVVIRQYEGGTQPLEDDYGYKSHIDQTIAKDLIEKQIINFFPTFFNRSCKKYSGRNWDSLLHLSIALEVPG